MVMYDTAAVDCGDDAKFYFWPRGIQIYNSTLV